MGNAQAQDQLNTSSLSNLSNISVSSIASTASSVIGGGIARGTTAARSIGRNGTGSSAVGSVNGSSGANFGSLSSTNSNGAPDVDDLDAEDERQPTFALPEGICSCRIVFFQESQLRGSSLLLYDSHRDSQSAFRKERQRSAAPNPAVGAAPTLGKKGSALHATDDESRTTSGSNNGAAVGIDMLSEIVFGAIPIQLTAENTKIHALPGTKQIVLTKLFQAGLPAQYVEPLFKKLEEQYSQLQPTSQDVSPLLKPQIQPLTMANLSRFDLAASAQPSSSMMHESDLISINSSIGAMQNDDTASVISDVSDSSVLSYQSDVVRTYLGPKRRASNASRPDIALGQMQHEFIDHDPYARRQSLPAFHMMHEPNGQSQDDEPPVQTSALTSALTGAPASTGQPDTSSDFTTQGQSHLKKKPLNSGPIKPTISRSSSIDSDLSVSSVTSLALPVALQRKATQKLQQVQKQKRQYMCRSLFGCAVVFTLNDVADQSPAANAALQQQLQKLVLSHFTFIEWRLRKLVRTCLSSIRSKLRQAVNQAFEREQLGKVFQGSTFSVRLHDQCLQQEDDVRRATRDFHRFTRSFFHAPRLDRPLWLRQQMLPEERKRCFSLFNRSLNRMLRGREPSAARSNASSSQADVITPISSTPIVGSLSSMLSRKSSKFGSMMGGAAPSAPHVVLPSSVGNTVNNPQLIKAREQFIYRVFSAVLSNHLSWTERFRQNDADQQSGNLLIRRLLSLFGASYWSTEDSVQKASIAQLLHGKQTASGPGKKLKRLCRVIVVGSDAKQIRSMLQLLSYIIRSDDISETDFQFPSEKHPSKPAKSSSAWKDVKFSSTPQSPSDHMPKTPTAVPTSPWRARLSRRIEETAVADEMEVETGHQSDGAEDSEPEEEVSILVDEQAHAGHIPAAYSAADITALTSGSSSSTSHRPFKRNATEGNLLSSIGSRSKLSSDSAPSIPQPVLVAPAISVPPIVHIIPSSVKRYAKRKRSEVAPSIASIASIADAFSPIKPRRSNKLIRSASAADAQHPFDDVEDAESLNEIAKRLQFGDSKDPDARQSETEEDMSEADDIVDEEEDEEEEVPTEADDSKDEETTLSSNFDMVTIPPFHAIDSEKIKKHALKNRFSKFGHALFGDVCAQYCGAFVMMGLLKGTDFSDDVIADLKLMQSEKFIGDDESPHITTCVIVDVDQLVCNIIACKKITDEKQQAANGGSCHQIKFEEARSAPIVQELLQHLQQFKDMGIEDSFCESYFNDKLQEIYLKSVSMLGMIEAFVAQLKKQREERRLLEQIRSGALTKHSHLMQRNMSASAIYEHSPVSSKKYLLYSELADMLHVQLADMPLLLSIASTIRADLLTYVREKPKQASPSATQAATSSILQRNKRHTVNLGPPPSGAHHAAPQAPIPRTQEYQHNV